MPIYDIDGNRISGDGGGAEFQKLRIMTYNIGHFSGGNNQDSSISASDYEAKKAAFRTLINSIGADFCGIEEYSSVFYDTHTARDVVFPNYKEYNIGAQRKYSCNALFSNLTLDSVQTAEYDANVNPDPAMPSTPGPATNYYYLHAVATLLGLPVDIIVTHLAFNGSTLVVNQMQELITEFADRNHVIIMGDFNASNSARYELFESAGYQLANHGYLGDLATDRRQSNALDNIIVKGFQITHTEMVESDLSDHNPLVCDLSISD